MKGIIYHGSQNIIEVPEFGKEIRLMTTGLDSIARKIRNLQRNGLLPMTGMGMPMRMRLSLTGFRYLTCRKVIIY